MPTIRFRGRVYPAFVSVDTPRLDVLWPAYEGYAPMPMSVHIAKSVVEVECVGKNYAAGEDVSLHHIRALELARSAVDCIAYLSATGLTVILDEVNSPEGSVSNLLMQNKPLLNACTAFSLSPTAKAGENMEAMYRIVVSSPDLFKSLNELIVAITSPGQVAVNCGRAIEGLRRMIVPIDPSRKLGWTKMQDYLNIGRSYREFIMTASTEPRHGDRSDVPAHISQQVVERSWVIMNRFLEYKKRGDKPLPIAEFPLLS